MMGTERLMISVDAHALKAVLMALVGPDHHIRELQYTRGLPGHTNPIDVLLANFNAAVTKEQR